MLCVPNPARFPELIRLRCPCRSAKLGNPGRLVIPERQLYSTVLPTRNAAMIISQTIPSVCQNQAQNVTPHEYSWS